MICLIAQTAAVGRGRFMKLKMASAQAARTTEKNYLNALRAAGDGGQTMKLKTTNARSAGVKWMKMISMIKLLNFKRLNILLGTFKKYGK